MPGPEQLSFPDGPRLALDEALAALMAQANKVRATQERLRALLSATQVVVEESDLAIVLRRLAQDGDDPGERGVRRPRRDRS
jgi:hypothetical protein